MTTIISIKSQEGIILASDSQGTSSKIKTNVKKIFEVGSRTGLAATGDHSQIELLVEDIKQHLRNHELQLESEFKNQIYSILTGLNRMYNHNHSFQCGYNEPRLFFSPLSVVATKPDNGDAYFYRMGFGTIGKNNEVSPFLYRINRDYISIGSGSTLARLVLGQQERFYSTIINKKLSELSTHHIIGIASYVIDEVKQLDLETGGRNQIAVIDKDGYREIGQDDQIKSQHIMIEGLCSYLQKCISKNTGQFYPENDNVVTIKREELKTIIQKIFSPT